MHKVILPADVQMRTAASLAVALALTCACAHAGAQQYPQKPVRLIVASAPGGGVDVLARIIAPKLGELVGQPVIVDNRPGAGSTIGYEHGIRSAPDGYTLTLITPSYTINPSFYSLKFDALVDFTPITLVARFPHVIVVHPSLPARNIRELIALAKANPGTIAFGSSGQGAIVHLTTEVFLDRAGIRMTHVPYRGGAPALTDVIAGQISMVFATPQTSLPHVKAQRVRALAVTTKERLPAEPAIPTVAEGGLPGFDMSSWHGLIGPRGLPQAVVERVNHDVGHVIRMKEVEARMQASGVSPATSSPEELRTLIQREVAIWKEVIARTGVKVQ
jgi:tripartite-type tricarboxylate transporter receptor subunit TctC